MTTEVTVSANLNELASQLGVGATELIAMYAPRAYAELADPFLTAGVAVAMWGVSKSIGKWSKRRAAEDTRFDWEVASAVQWGVGGLAGFFVLLTAAEIKGAISALASPEGWAVEQILKTLAG